jgi:hypothetical protein
MDDSVLRQFFLQPKDPGQRRYEAVRAVVVDRCLVSEVAQRFGFAYGSLRNLVSQCRAQVQLGLIPPFLLSTPFKTGRTATAPLFPTLRRSPIAVASRLLPL